MGRGKYGAGTGACEYSLVSRHGFCDDDNIGSIRTIEKNGGVLENVVIGGDLQKLKRRYWLETG